MGIEAASKIGKPSGKLNVFNAAKLANLYPGKAIFQLEISSAKGQSGNPTIEIIKASPSNTNFIALSTNNFAVNFAWESDSEFGGTDGNINVNGENFNIIDSATWSVNAYRKDVAGTTNFNVSVTPFGTSGSFSLKALIICDAADLGAINYPDNYNPGALAGCVDKFERLL